MPLKKQTKTNPGEPYKFDAKRRALFLELLSQGIGRGKASVRVGMSVSGVRYYLTQINPDFEAEILEAEMQANDDVENALYRNATQKMNVIAQLSWLYNRCPERWTDKRNSVEVLRARGANGSQIESIRVEGKVTEDLIKALASLDLLERQGSNGQVIELSPHEPESSGNGKA